MKCISLQKNKLKKLDIFVKQYKTSVISLYSDGLSKFYIGYKQVMCQHRMTTHEQEI